MLTVGYVRAVAVYDTTYFSEFEVRCVKMYFPSENA